MKPHGHRVTKQHSNAIAQALNSQKVSSILPSDHTFVPFETLVATMAEDDEGDSEERRAMMLIDGESRFVLGMGQTSELFV